MEDNKRITNVVICYANPDEVISYAIELSRQSISKNIVLAIVINKASDIQIEQLKRGLSNIELESRIYYPKENLGYLNGLVYGYKHLRCDGLETDWVVFSNTDILIPDIDFFLNFINGEQYKNKDVWVVGPSVFAINQKKYTNPYKISRTSKRSIISTNIIMSVPHIFHFLHLMKAHLKKNTVSTKDTVSKQIYAIHGSFMFLRKEIVRAIESNRPWELLYNEESYIAEIARKNNKVVYYDSRIEVQHTEGTSTGKVNIAPRYRLMKKANSRILEEFY